MKCFLVYVEVYDYDQYDEVVVLAESEKEVREMFIKDEGYTYIGKDGPWFYDSQGKIYIEEMTERGVVSSSFNAG